MPELNNTARPDIAAEVLQAVRELADFDRDEPNHLQATLIDACERRLVAEFPEEMYAEGSYEYHLLLKGAALGSRVVVDIMEAVADGYIVSDRTFQAMSEGEKLNFVLGILDVLADLDEDDEEEVEEDDEFPSFESVLAQLADIFDSDDPEPAFL